MQAFSFQLDGTWHTVDLAPFGESGHRLGATARAELAATELNRILVLLPQAKYRHGQLKVALLQRYDGKDSDAAKTRYLELSPEYLESERTVDFLDGAYKAMLYGHYPRIRAAEEHARQLERGASQVSRTPHY